MSGVKLIQRLLENEYEFKDPWKISKGTGFILPITGTSPFQDRNYVLLEEVKDQVSLEDTGGIYGVNFTNKSGETVYVRKGTILKGQGTQSRSPVSSIVLEPNEVIVKVPVNCIHASHGINARSHFVVGDVVPHEVEKSLGEQSNAWNSISSLSLSTRIPQTIYRHGAGFYSSGDMSQAAISFSGMTDDNLAGWSDAMESIKDTVDDVLKDIPGDYVNQVGVAVFDLNGVVGVEIFNHPESWKAYSDNIVRSYAKTLTETSDLYEIKTENAKENLIEFLSAFKNSEKTVISSNSVSSVWALKTDIGFGETTEVHGEEIHLSLAKSDEGETVERPNRNMRWGEYQTTFREGSDFHMDISDWSTRRGSYTLLGHLEEQPQRFTELLNNMDVSRGTLSTRLTEASDMDLIHRAVRKENGAPVYTLTEKGKEAKKLIEHYSVDS